MDPTNDTGLSQHTDQGRSSLNLLGGLNELPSSSGVATDRFFDTNTEVRSNEDRMSELRVHGPFSCLTTPYMKELGGEHDHCPPAPC